MISMEPESDVGAGGFEERKTGLTYTLEPAGSPEKFMSRDLDYEKQDRSDLFGSPSPNLPLNPRQPCARK